MHVYYNKKWYIEMLKLEPAVQFMILPERVQFLLLD